MAINFPNSPVNGNTYKYNEVTYIYSKNGTDEGYWRVALPSTSGVASVAEIDAGINAVKYISPATLEGSKYKVPLPTPLVVVDNISTLLNLTVVGGIIYRPKDFISNSGDNLGGEWIFDETVSKDKHDGSHTISTTVPWNGLSGQDQQNFIDGVGEANVGGLGCLVRQFTKGIRNLEPLYIEQHLTGLYGRGQLDVEANNLFTTQPIVGTFAEGVAVVTVTNGADFDIGGHITILHDNGLYWTYRIAGISINDLTIRTPLKYAVSNKTCERTWYNKAHPGKYYMRQLAQRVALSKEYKVSLPSERQFFTQFDSNPTNEIDLMTPIAGGIVNYFDANSVGDGIGSPTRFVIGRTAFISVTTTGDGAKTYEFPTNGKTSVLLRMVVSMDNTNQTLRVRLRDKASEVYNWQVWETVIPASDNNATPKYFDFPIQLSGGSTSAWLEFTAGNDVAGNILIDQIEVSDLNASNQTLKEAGEGSVLVALGDSWIAGDLVSSVEREPMTYELQKQLPHMKVINAGFGGNKAGDLIARFDTDVAPHKPDYVLINTGTNDAYSPISGTFKPNSVEIFAMQIAQLVSKIQTIGAKPIIIGAPALAESDGSYTNFELNERAREYSQYFYKRFGRVSTSALVGKVTQVGGVPMGAVIESTNTGIGIVTKFADGTMIVTREVDMDTTVTSGIVTNFPEAFLSGTTPTCSMAIKTISSGNTTTAMSDAFLRCVGNTQWVTYFPTAGSVTETFNLTAIGRWF